MFSISQYAASKIGFRITGTLTPQVRHLCFVTYGWISLPRCVIQIDPQHGQAVIVVVSGWRVSFALGFMV
jgi:hypothetical protein